MELIIILATVVLGKTIYGKSFGSEEDRYLVDYNYFEYFNLGDKEVNPNIENMLYPESKENINENYGDYRMFQKKMIVKDNNDLGDYFYDSSKVIAETEKPFRSVDYKFDDEEENVITHRKNYYNTDIPPEFMSIKEQKLQEIARGLYFHDVDGRLVLDFFEYDR